MPEGGNRAPAIAVWPGKFKSGVSNHDIVGGLDLMAIFAFVGGAKLPTKGSNGFGDGLKKEGINIPLLTGN